MKSTTLNGANILRNGRLFFAFLIIIMFGHFQPSSAGWSDDIRLTYYSDDEYLPQVISRNDTVHVVWTHDNWYIGYLRSIDGGTTWDSLRILSEEGHFAYYPDISIGENGLLVTWSDHDYLGKIAYTMSVDGSEWTSPVYLPTDHIEHIFMPASAVWGNLIFIAYFSNEADSTGNRPIQFFSSYDYGQTWNDELTVDYRYSTQQDLILTRCGYNLLLVKSGFVDSLHSGYHIVGYHSDDGGQSWSDMIWISPEHPPMAQDPCVACSEETGQFAVGYMDYRFQEYAFFGDIFIAISDNDGLTWTRETRATLYPTATAPAIDFAGDTLTAIWSDRRFGGSDLREIYYNRSDNSGVGWLGEERLTEGQYISTEPWISFDDSIIHVIWREGDESNGNDIYYKHFTPEGSAIDDNNSKLPKEIYLSIYPNPFNSFLRVTTNTISSGTLQIYDILGKLLKEYNYNAGITSLTWDARDARDNPVSTGVYFIKMKGGEENDIIKKVIYLK